MIKRINLGGNSNLGVVISATDEVAIVPSNISENLKALIEECLSVSVIKTSICGSSLAGALVAGNSNGFALSKYTLKSEIERIREFDVEVEKIPDKFTAVGNIVLSNDFGALVSPLLSDKSLKIIKDVLNVEVEKGTIAKFKITGSVATATNKGVLTHPSTTQEELEFIENVLKVPADIGTINNGVELVGACAVANTSGVLVGADTTGPELARVEEAFGFLEGGV